MKIATEKNVREYKDRIQVLDALIANAEKGYAVINSHVNATIDYDMTVYYTDLKQRQIREVQALTDRRDQAKRDLASLTPPATPAPPLLQILRRPGNQVVRTEVVFQNGY